MQEPLKYWFNKIGFNPEEIKQLATGEKYSAVMLHNGRIGVCANLGHAPSTAIPEIDYPDLNNVNHRIVYNAYLNAKLNYLLNTKGNLDIFDHIDFSKQSRIVMIGHFKPLAAKFQDKNIHLKIYDKVGEDPILQPIEEMNVEIGMAHTLILTSTTIFNQSFLKIVNQTNEKCKVFLLGPSTPLNKDLYQYKNISGIYGAVFEPNDANVLKLISEGKGTRSFLPYGKKVFI